MNNTKSEYIAAPWTPELAETQDSPRVPVLECVIPLYGYMEVETLDDVFDNFHDGMILCKSRVRGFFLVVPLE